MYFKRIAAVVLLFAAGVACGGYLFSRSEPRSFLSFETCREGCFDTREVTGLMMSAAIARAPFLIPGVVLESDQCLAIRDPRSRDKIHYVLFPKRDVKNIAVLTPEDAPYLLGCLAMVRELVARDNLKAYRFYTNGPGYQEVAYLHFHLIAK